MLINVVLCLLFSFKITAPLVQPLLTDFVDKPPMEAAFFMANFIETWKPVDGLPNYEVSNLGNVKALPKQKWNGNGYQTMPEKMLTACKIKNGYMVVNAMSKVRYVHRLVALSFLKDSEYYGLDVNHIDGNKSNNAVTNLEWCNRKQNIKHSFKIGLSAKGENRTQSILMEAEVAEIKATHRKTGLGKTALQKLFPKVSVSCIQSILEKRSWAHVD